MIFTIESGESHVLSEGEVEIEMGNAYQYARYVPEDRLSIQLTIEEDELQFIQENTPNWSTYTTEEKFNYLKDMWAITLRINYLKERLSTLHTCVESDEEYENGDETNGDQEDDGEYVMEDENMNDSVNAMSDNATVSSIEAALAPTDITAVLDKFISMQVH